MSALTPSNILIVLAFVVGLIVIVAIAAHFNGINLLPEEHEEYDDPSEQDDEDYDDDDDDDYDDDDDDDDYEEWEPEFVDAAEPAVDINDTAALNMRLLAIRLNSPRLLQDDWYEISRREFSIKMVEEAQRRATWRKSMGLSNAA